MKTTNSSEAFKQAVIANDLTAIEGLLQEAPALAEDHDNKGVSLLLIALYHGHADIAARMAAVRDDLDIFEAAAIGELARLRRLLDDDSETFGSYAADGFTPLHLAVFFKRNDVVQFILANGGDVEAIARNDSHVRPLHSAAATRDERTVRVILSAGADPDAKQTGGHTALHSAVMHGNVQMTKVLLESGADPAVRNDEGNMAIDMIAGTNRDALKKLLQICSADGSLTTDN